MRPSLSGYQAGACFYCGGADYSLSGFEHSADVDHYFPHVLMSRGLDCDLDGVWNLVLACTTCNRGNAGKGHRLAHGDFLDRLHHRNERLIGSHHPLREAMIRATGRASADRLNFLRAMQTRALDYTRADWRPPR